MGSPPAQIAVLFNPYPLSPLQSPLAQIAVCCFSFGLYPIPHTLLLLTYQLSPLLRQVRVLKKASLSVYNALALMALAASATPHRLCGSTILRQKKTSNTIQVRALMTIAAAACV